MELSKLAKDVLGEYEALVFQTFEGEKPTASFNGRQISRMTNIPKTTTQRILTKLHAVGVLNADEHLSMTLYSLNRDHILYNPLKELFSLRDQFLAELTESYSQLFPEDLTLLLYGSVARLDSKAESDVNILAIVKDDSALPFDELDEVTNQLQKRIGNIINLRILTDIDLRKMRRSKDQFLTTVLDEHKHLLGLDLPQRVKQA
jgi:predicted nucleotidyltransferase